MELILMAAIAALLVVLAHGGFFRASQNKSRADVVDRPFGQVPLAALSASARRWAWAGKLPVAPKIEFCAHF